MSDNFNKNRILKNSILLYVRMLFTMWLNLYATRLVLANLGVEDMGVYGVVGSIVSMIGVFTGGITNAVQRFITYELGRKDGEPNIVFCSSLNVIFIVSVIAIVLLEVVGLWMLYNKVNIPEHSMDAAFWVYQLSVFTCIVNLISIPYNALIIAHEKMGTFAGISILQVVLTFLSAYCISFFDNRLLIYGILMSIVSVVIRIIYQIYCHLKFSESTYCIILDKKIMKQIGKFTGVSTVSGGLQTLSAQGIVFVINITFGVAINAVYAISLQLKNSVQSFAFNLFKAISPQITKTYASGEYTLHKKLVYGGAKLEVFMIYFIMIPFVFKTKYIMLLWLGDVPDYIVEFTRCTILLSMTYAFFEPIRTSVLSTNRIVKFLLIPDMVNLLVLPISYFVCRLTNSPNLLIISIVTIDIFVCCIRTFYAMIITPLLFRELLRETLLPVFVVGSIGVFAANIISPLFNNTIFEFCIFLVANSLALLVIIYTCGLSSRERLIVCNTLKDKLKRGEKN